MRIICIGLCMVWLTTLASANSTNDFKVFCYYGDWSYSRPGIGEFEISDIDPNLCTHVIYAFLFPGADGNVRYFDPSYELSTANSTGGFERFVALKEQNKELKTIISLGGYTAGVTNFSTVANDDNLRAAFVQNIVKFLCDYGFDGLDVDWQYPNQRGGVASDVQSFVYLLEELHEAFHPHGFILSATVGAGESTTATSYNVSGIAAAVDYINLLTYGYHSASDGVTGHNAPLYPAKRETTASDRALNVNASVHNWISLGAPASKILLSTGTYGKSFTLNDTSLHVPGSPVSGTGTIGTYSQEAGSLLYYEICSANWTVVYDEEQQAAYAYSGDQWVGFDNVRSLTEKANYIKSMGLAGTAVWAIDLDDFRGICGVKYPLITAMKNVLCN